jgi:hypothetical protein
VTILVLSRSSNVWGPAVTRGKHDRGHAAMEVRDDKDEADLVQDLEVEDADADEVKGGAQSLGGDAPEPGVKLNHSERVLP